MAIRIKVDEDLPREVAAVFRTAGHDAVTVYEQQWNGTPDEELWPLVQAEGRWLVTADKGFGDIRRYPPGAHHGVVLFRLERESRGGYIKLAEAFLQLDMLERFSGSIVVVSHAGARVQHPPAGH